MAGLPRATFEVPLDAGLITRGDKRAKDAIAAEQLLNAEFDDVGGLRVRFPFGVTSNAIAGGGTLANCRKLAFNGNELVCFTSTALYAWAPALQAWEYIGDHLAVMVDEQTVFARTDDQIYCDRAEFANQIVYVWQTEIDDLQIAVVDKATGTTIQPPLKVPFGFGVAVQPHLIALDDCVILLCVNAAGVTLQGAKITLGPFTLGSFNTLATFHGSTYSYDVARIPGQNRAYIVANQAGSSSSNYAIIELNSSLTGTSQLAAAQTAVGPMAIAISPDAAHCTIIQHNGNVYADIWTVPATGAPTAITSFAVHLGTNGTGSSAAQVAAAFRSVQNSGVYRCYVFWTLDESSTAVFENRSNWIDTSGTLGTAVGNDMHFVYALGLGSRAFAYGSNVYVWGTFAGLSFAATDPTGTHSQLQNTYYLYRDDGLLIAKAVWGEGAGFHLSGWLPNVAVDSANANKFFVMEGIRRIVPVGSNATDPADLADNYAERAPREVAFTLDDDRARRCVRLGNTLYVTGGLVLQYDGARLAEVGFCVYPWLFEVSQGSSGNIAVDGYSYKGTVRWNNAAGELERSTTATVDNITLTGSASKVTANPTNLYVTRKPNVAIEMWRTEGNPPDGAPFFLVTSQDPSVITGTNIYLANNPASISFIAFSDNLADASIAVLPASPENDGSLESLEPPPASIIATDAQRLYLAGIPGYPNTVYYSKYREDGSVVAFNDYLSFEVPAAGGAITALGYLDGGLIVWCETATYQYAGPGFDDTAGGSNFTLARTLSTSLGAISQDAIEFSEGVWYVKTQLGWYLLDPGLNYTDINEGPYRYDDEPVLAIVAMKTRHQVRVVTPNRVLVLDTLVKKWAEWTIDDGLDMVLDAASSCWYLTPTGPRQEIATWSGYAGTDASLAVAELETTWIKPDGRQQGRYVVDYLQLLGEFRSACAVNVKIAKDYEQTSPGNPNWHTDKTWSPFPTINGNGLELRAAPTKKRCASIKARISITNPDGSSPLGGPCVRLTSLTGQYAVEPGIYGALASAQKQ